VQSETEDAAQSAADVGDKGFGHHAPAAAALILSCAIVSSIRWPRPGVRPPQSDHDGKEVIHTRAVPLLSSMATTSAGLGQLGDRQVCQLPPQA
jgi:hypothetical protein